MTRPRGAAPAAPASVPDEPALPPGLAWAGVVVLGLCGALAAILEMLLVPLYAGSSDILVPVTLPLAIISNIVLPRLALRLVTRMAAAAIPLVFWLVVVIVFGTIARPEGDVILPGGGAVQWVSYGVMLLGFLAGLVTVILSVPPPASRRPGPPPTRHVTPPPTRRGTPPRS